MASRSEWFKQFVRSLDEKAPYEERKDLALNALRKRYGQESSLLASEDRLLAGACQHRAGKFPWGTSKKDREKSRKLSSLGSVKVPLPAGSARRTRGETGTPAHECGVCVNNAPGDHLAALQPCGHVVCVN